MRPNRVSTNSPFKNVVACKLLKQKVEIGFIEKSKIWINIRTQKICRERVNQRGSYSIQFIDFKQNMEYDWLKQFKLITLGGVLTT